MYELKLNIANRQCSVFLQNGFYHPSRSQNIHKHNYDELHVVSGGAVAFMVEGKKYTVKDGELLVIPRGRFHSWLDEEDHTLHSALQVDVQHPKTEIIKADPSVIRGLFNEIEKCNTSNDHTVIAAYIPLLCSYLNVSDKQNINEVSDAGMLIEVFFSTSYEKDVHLEDLAQILHLSLRQTERKLIEHTGNNFKEELASTRISIAKYLIESTDMSLTEIAQYVGYRSYAGFWKAMKKYGS
ncbi:MAG: AraC family transcriptional regulator [Ruminococcaceae bacterium]|nr:AraC family transcriptional regulator [Oscillospiraceae bacterium]